MIVESEAEKCIYWKIQSNGKTKQNFLFSRDRSQNEGKENHLIYKQYFHENNYETECMLIHLVNSFLKL